MSSEKSSTFKILTIGNSGVGKTCILRRFVENKFLKTHLATIGIDFKTKTLNINNKEIKLKIWDTAGQERFSRITTQYYKGADGIVLVYDVTDDDSYEKIRDWMAQIKANTEKDELGFVLLGNKCDVDEAFEHLAREIMKKKGVGDDHKVGGMELNNNKNKKKEDKGGCC